MKNIGAYGKMNIEEYCKIGGSETVITFVIDGLTPCLKDSLTGEIVDTEVIELKRKSLLSEYNSRSGWYVN